MQKVVDRYDKEGTCRFLALCNASWMQVYAFLSCPYFNYKLVIYVALSDEVLGSN